MKDSPTAGVERPHTGVAKSCFLKGLEPTAVGSQGELPIRYFVPSRQICLSQNGYGEEEDEKEEEEEQQQQQ